MSTTIANKHLKLLDLPSETLVQICDSFYGSFRWDLVTFCIKGPNDSYATPECVVLLRRVPPLPQTLALVHPSLTTMAIKARQHSVEGYTGRCLIDNHLVRHHWLDQDFLGHIKSFWLSPKFPTWALTATKRVSYPKQFSGRDLAEVTRTSFPFATGVEELDTWDFPMTVYGEASDSEDSQSLGAMPRALLNFINPLLNKSPEFVQSFRDYELDLTFPCWRHMLPPSLPMVIGGTKFKWITVTNVIKRFPPEGHIETQIENEEYWVLE